MRENERDLEMHDIQRSRVSMCRFETAIQCMERLSPNTRDLLEVVSYRLTSLAHATYMEIQHTSHRTCLSDTWKISESR